MFLLLRSVLDLSLARTATTFETHHGGYTSHTSHTSHTPRAPSSPSHPAYSKGLGDLRNISRKPWSKSADDLGKMPHAISPTLSPIDTAFQGKIEQYRNNRNDSVSSSNLPSPSTSPAPSIHKGYPFPTTVATEALSSSPPQMLGVLNPATSSASGGNSPVTPGSGGHVHSRSHSFTPRLPSKLSAPKLGGLAPASPKRKGSASSEVELNKERTNRMEEKDKNDSTGSLGAGPSPRPGFPFNFVNGSGSSKSLSPLNTDMGPSSGEKTSPSSALLAPPTIIEPGADLDFKHEKRTSQVIYHSGFINRMADFNPALMNARANHSYMSGSGAPALAKGWKPFKLVMKGSKLYFYKPPSDRSNAIKDLFPTELVVVLEDEGVTEEPEPQENEMEEMPVMKAREKDEGRRRRAYWGRGTHPSLVYNKSGIERGTFEALVHEAVFGTTFLLMPVAGNTTAGASEDHAPSRYRPDWHDFSATVLLTLPVLVGRSQFEAEFFRCCTLLVDGADDDFKEDEVSRVCWLATQYLVYFESPVDTVAWEVWRKNIIPDFPSCSPAKSKTAGFPQSSSMQALYTTSPMLTPSPRKPGTEFSPNLGAFSPRPDGNDRMASLMDALGDTRSMRSPSSKPVKAWRIVLDRTGLTRDVLLNLDAQLVARSLYVFHQQELQHVPENVTAECWFEVESEEPSPEAASHSAVPGSGAAQMPPPATLKLFFGSEEHPHWLTKIVLLQILISDSAGRPANGTSSLGYGAEDRLSSQTSRTHSRSDVIVAWARIGEVCRRTGDECSWRAIFAALCSRPIARLEKVWKRVDGDAVRTIHSWVHPHHGDVSDVEIKAIPWAGDCIVQSREALDSARAEEGNEWNVTFLMQCRQHFETLRTDFSLCPKKVDVPDGGESEDVLALMAHWRQLSDGGNTAGGIASKFNRCVSLVDTLFLFHNKERHSDFFFLLVSALINSCRSLWQLNPVEEALLSLTFGHDLLRIPSSIR